jgi:hypothetical protein
VRCHVTTPDGSDSVKIEWDPLNDEGLVRYASLVGASDAVVSCSADPSRHAVQGDLNFAWQFEAKTVSLGSTGNSARLCGLPGAGTPLVPPSTATPPPPCSTDRVELVAVTVIGANTPPLTAQSNALAPTVAQRAFGLPSTPGLVDLAGVITEIIVERAEAEMMRVATRQLKDALGCTGTSKTSPAPGSPPPPTWTNFCHAIETVRLEDAVTTIDTLMVALGEDMLVNATKSLAPAGAGGPNPAIKSAVDLAREVLRGQREGLRGASQRLIVEAASAKPNFQAALSMVLQGTSADATRVRQIAGVDAEVLADAYTVMRPNPESTESERLRVALSVIARLDPAGAKPELIALLDAALQRDLVRMAPALGALLGLTAQQKRALTLVSALGAHLSSPADGAKLSEEEKAARREARKASIKSLLEMQTLRGQRKGDWIVSVGGHVGGQFAWSRQTTGVPEEEPSTSFASQPLTARLGFALDHHCRDSVVGFHAEVMPIDLGAFVNLQTTEESGVEEVDPAALLQPSFSAGPSFLFSDESDAFFFVGPTVGVDPGFGSGATKDTRVFFGGSLGVFVPLVDLN